MGIGGGAAEVTVIVPTLNEEEGIGPTLEEIIAAGIPPQRIIVIDGGSSDRTVEIARSYGVRVVEQRSRGKAGAIKEALALVDTEFFAVIDGDYTYPGKRIPELVRKAAAEDLDEVIGARVYFEPGSQSLVFRVGNRILTTFFNMVFGTKLRDVLSGLYVVRKRALLDAAFETRGFSIESEIAAHIASTSGRIADVPVEYRRRRGVKKLGVRHGLQIAIDIFRLSLRYNPLFTIAFLGSLLLIPGLALLAYVAYYYIFLKMKLYVKALIAIALTAAGAQSLTIAALSAYLRRMEQRLRALILHYGCQRCPSMEEGQSETTRR